MRDINSALRAAISNIRGLGGKPEPSGPVKCSECGDSGMVMSPPGGRVYATRCKCQIGACIPVERAVPFSRSEWVLVDTWAAGRIGAIGIIGGYDEMMTAARAAARQAGGSVRYCDLVTKCPTSTKNDKWQGWESHADGLARASVVVVGPDLCRMKWEQVPQLALLARAIRGRGGRMVLVGGVPGRDGANDDWMAVHSELDRLKYGEVFV